MNTDGYLAVNFCAGDLLQQWSTFIRCRLQEGSKTALGQQYGAGKPLKVHTAQPFNLFGYTAQPGFINLTSLSIGDFVLGCLQFTIWPAPCTMLAPVATVTAR